MIDGNAPRRKLYTQKDYIKYLNDLGYALSDDEFIIGGKMRRRRDNYGQLIHDYDPIAFHVGFNEWKIEKQGHI